MKDKTQKLMKQVRSWVVRAIKSANQSKLNANKQAKREQLKHAAVLLVIGVVSFVFYSYSSFEKKTTTPVNDAQFDGVFDQGFQAGSDEALIEKQQRQIDALKDAVTAREKASIETKDSVSDVTKSLLLAMQEKLKVLEADNKKTNEQLQVALAMQAQQRDVAPTHEEMEAARIQRQHDLINQLTHAGLETVRFHSCKKSLIEERTSKNYVWAGTFVEGVLLTGILGDAGINGSKNMGTAMIRLTTGGIMPNEQHSYLDGCFALVSSYGDLSGSSVVLHLETLSCAGKNINFEQKVYGSVFDLDAMQDLRGTPILKTKPLLEYTAAAGMLAGLGDGLKNYGTAQTIDPAVGTITTYGSSQAVAQSAIGGALTNPANRISDYVMKIADIYHPLVVARAGRRVSVLFTKGFWIDKEHQAYESGKSIDENSKAATDTTQAVSTPGITTQVSRASEIGLTTKSTDAFNLSSGSQSEQELTKPMTPRLPLFSTVNNNVEPAHG